MKRCSRCVYLKRGINFAYCMFFCLPGCPGDDGLIDAISYKQNKQVTEEVNKQIERGIEFPKPYKSRRYKTKFDYFAHHDLICQRFYIDGCTYSEIADELGGYATSTGLRHYIMKCEKCYDEERRTI